MNKTAGSLFSLANVQRQYVECHRHKRNTANALRFEAAQEMNLLALRDALADRSYEPARSVCFFVQRPKWVFRKSVTGHFGIVTGDFGNVTGHFGDVTDRSSSAS